MIERVAETRRHGSGWIAGLDGARVGIANAIAICDATAEMMERGGCLQRRRRLLERVLLVRGLDKV